MKNVLFTLFTLLFLTGCSITGHYNKLHFVKADQHIAEKQRKAIPETEQVERTESSFTTEDTLTTTNETQLIIPVSQENQVTESRKTPNHSVQQSVHQEKKSIAKKVNDIDPDEEDPDDDEDHVDEALETERNARIAVILYAVSIITAFTLMLGVIFFFVARMYYRRANDSGYNTAQGAKLLNAAAILRIIALVFLILDLIYFLFILGALIYLLFFGWW